MPIGSFNLERENFLIGKTITLKLYCLRILAIEKPEYGKRYSNINDRDVRDGDFVI